MPMVFKGGHGTNTPSARAEAVAVPKTFAGRALQTVLAYIALTKPKVIELLLVATIPVMLLADRGHVNLGLILSTLFGGWLGAASANTLNMVADADIDKKMKRTERRPLARQAVPTRHALIFGIALAAASFAWLSLTTNLLAASLVLVTIAFYLFVYTMLLKRRTSQNVVWGGAAGCMPTLVGWAAATGTIQWPAIVLFLVIFFWTPPHTWALAMRYREDYKAAGVPMLPVVAPETTVARQMVWYTWATVITTLVLIPAAGVVYAVAAALCGAWFLYAVHKLYNQTKAGQEIKPLKVFLQSNNYLAVLFCALSVDSILNYPTVGHLLGL
ncbi:Protoheme IX farnesyltransferase OS=Tsukamurella paurometabola (strain ATCC 8368 / DSM / CCUG 35730 / CIP 100753 / JCM 10117 / KCTC 9821 / NBRC 16120 /NCIMB 702349 / NCTC 13040) OX=521096 GN=ctaB PE=3 SV=1 [Tsukamurella paurometabola]|uniref:Protoheme IX farnesyltransferase n=2 Tax=Tsukamurella paurometabola TaxID=2061 RepID=D5URS0_TSUPD|nr:protoheme IX farnesyltransferase [Tsukamurella paurometabola DSM 20162]SUP34176.1 Protoheme IX farnesyltransferase [Tsukamurella paurometabola]